MGKITMQDIADALNVSRVTVCKAFNNQTGVSDSLRQMIFEKAQKMGYKKAAYKITEQVQKEVRTISLIVSRPDSSTFWTNIIHRLAQELAIHNINLMYTYIPSSYAEDFVLPAILFNGNVSGCIVLNVYDSKILSLISELSIPKVFLDCVPSIRSRSLKGDLFLIEGYGSEYDITNFLIKKGLKDIGFIGDVDYAQTNADRYRGYTDCITDNRLSLDHDLCYTLPIDIYSYDTQLSFFLENLKVWPQAFVCVSDYVAHFVRQYMDDNAGTIPPGVILTGFDNSKEYTNVVDSITTANVSTSLLGKRLAIQTLFRIEHADAPYELTYINPTLIFHEG